MPAITGTTKLTGLLGEPVNHSISPLIHNFSFQHLNLDYVYLCFQINEKTLEDAVKGLRILDVKGFNLTMPNKNKILSYLDSLSPAARLIGAVNTVENKNGNFIGHNTDGIGFMQSVKEQNIDMKNQTMTLLGIGGAATAICAQAALDGVNTIHIFSRPNSSHLPRIKTLQENLEKETTCKIFIHNLFDKQDLKSSVKDSSLLVNATSVGMAPHTEDCIIEDNSIFHKHLAVADIIYNPWETTLLKKAKAEGCKAFNGYSMLLYQGAEAFRIWTGKEIPIELVKEHLKQA
ncbi:shikimate dehydrogenase [Blautia sp. Marseille-P3201T]|uniref:shikimate dehydrogenase n=1 Tax=Blautia sp. Marseille-P3201T TaxID=1907659 RepID=UPI0009316469|nr:shikimate dehydrogenase [Blautia sp. Marseille-P3201T]